MLSKFLQCQLHLHTEPTLLFCWADQRCGGRAAGVRTGERACGHASARASACAVMRVRMRIMRVRASAWQWGWAEYTESQLLPGKSPHPFTSSSEALATFFPFSLFSSCQHYTTQSNFFNVHNALSLLHLTTLLFPHFTSQCWSNVVCLLGCHQRFLGQFWKQII